MSELSDADVNRIAAAVAAKMKTDAPTDAKIMVEMVSQEMATKGLSLLGIDIADKRQVEAFKLDIAFVRSLREFSVRTGRQVSSAITHAITWGVIGLLVLGFVLWSRDGAVPHSLQPPSITK